MKIKLNKIDCDGLKIEVLRSPKDKVLIIQIDGPKDEDCDPSGEPRVRIYLNDECIFENPEYDE